ncbi:MAG TPA: UDP-N-acetylmuramate--L-alanine ligase [Chloroflexi bacterium]|nr:UDP-N-acetylmuramate--L-alanine ligase [Chloroflexota bacterium]
MPHVHLIGIGGAGLSAIATVLLQQGYTVSGSDMQDSEAVARLRTLGATVHIGHRAKNIAAPDTVVYSSAIPADNPELIAARARQISTFKRPAWLGQMMRGKKGIAIAGTHGKTTTTSMAALILSEAGLSPSYIIGGFVPQLKSNAAAGNSDLFVIEADEYDRTFLSLKPEIAVITSLEWDHPDTYPTEASLREAFVEFVKLVLSKAEVSVPPAGKVILCADDAGAASLLEVAPDAATYGIQRDKGTRGQGDKETEGSPPAHLPTCPPAHLPIWRAVNVQVNRKGGYSFSVQHQGEIVTPQAVELSVPGLHNVQNALAALVAAEAVGVSPAEAGRILSTYTGVGRRFELKGEINGVTVIDDYAHHPSEIKATLSAARARYPQQEIYAVFQPHTFSRTKLLLSDFAAAFDQARHAIILDIFPSREKDDGSISSADIIARMQHPDARHIASMEEAVDYLRAHLTPGNVLITLGAGDGYRVGEMVLEAFCG